MLLPHNTAGDWGRGRMLGLGGAVMGLSASVLSLPPGRGHVSELDGLKATGSISRGGLFSLLRSHSHCVCSLPLAGHCAPHDLRSPWSCIPSHLLICVLDGSSRSHNHSTVADDSLFFAARYPRSRIPFHHPHLLGALLHPLFW